MTVDECSKFSVASASRRVGSHVLAFSFLLFYSCSYIDVSEKIKKLNKTVLGLCTLKTSANR